MDILKTIQSALGSSNKKDDAMSSVIDMIGGQGGLNNLISQFT